MLGSLRRALSVLNPFGAADEPPNGVENGGEVEVEVPQNAEGGGGGGASSACAKCWRQEI